MEIVVTSNVIEIRKSQLRRQNFLERTSLPKPFPSSFFGWSKISDLVSA